MKKSQLYSDVISYFEKKRPDAQTELVYTSPFELLVSVILSAQCTDKRVNMVTPYLFQRFPDAEAMAKADIDEVRELIKSISYPNSKAGYLIKASVIITERFKGHGLSFLPVVRRFPSRYSGSLSFLLSQMVVTPS